MVESKHEQNIVSTITEDQSREAHKLIRGSNSYRVLDIIKGKGVCVCVCVCRLEFKEITKERERGKKVLLCP